MKEELENIKSELDDIKGKIENNHTNINKNKENINQNTGAIAVLKTIKLFAIVFFVMWLITFIAFLLK